MLQPVDDLKLIYLYPALFVAFICYVSANELNENSSYIKIASVWLISLLSSAVYLSKTETFKFEYSAGLILFILQNEYCMIQPLNLSDHSFSSTHELIKNTK